MFAFTAKQDGKVLEVGEKHIKIKYKDGVETSIEIGRRFGSVPGTTIPHEVRTNMTVGKSFKSGAAIAYNTGYFEVNPLAPEQVTWKAGVMVKLVVMETPTTFEDACEVSEETAAALGTSLTQVRFVTTSFENGISNLVKVGDVVEAESILCTIEEGVIADNDLFDEKSMDTLKNLSANAPKAKYDGVVEKIEIFYHGDKEDMSESVKKLADKSDRERSSLLKSLGETITTGSVDGTVRFEKDPLDLDDFVIKIYITEGLPAGIGDKGVFGNQMKTIISGVMTGINRTESGIPLGAKFGYTSFSNRIVLSPEIIGTTNTVLIGMGKQVADEYFKNK